MRASCFGKQYFAIFDAFFRDALAVVGAYLATWLFLLVLEAAQG
jgi:hypothetical protein